MKKRILLLLLTLSMLFSVAPHAMGEEVSNDIIETTTQETLPCEEFKIAQSLSLINDLANHTDLVTRGDVAIAVARLLNLHEINVSNVDFADVQTGSKYFNAIGIVSTNKVMLGDGSGNFRPDDKISRAELATTLVRAIGYDIMAVNKGGYPNGYLATATELKFFTNVSISNEAEIKMDSFAKILYNLFDVEIMELASLPSNGNYEISDKTVLDIMNVVEIDGIVTKNNTTSLYSDNYYAIDRVLIGNIEVIPGQIDMSDMLGCRVHVFANATDDEYERYVYYAAPYKNEIIQISFEDMDLNYDIFKNYGVRYYNSNGRLLTEKFDTDYAVIYNNVAASFRTMSLITENDGYLSLVDNNQDGNIDVIFIFAYKDYVVDTINTERMTISDKYGKILALEDLEEDELSIVDASGKKKDLTSIYEWDVLSVFDSYVDEKSNSGRHFVQIFVSQDVISGAVAYVTESDGETILGIEEKEYSLSKFYKPGSKVAKYEVGASGNFYLNILGKICAYKLGSLESLDKQYGILVKAFIEEGLGEDVYYKIFTSTGEWITPIAAEKITVDGERKKDDDRYNCLLDNSVIKRQLIKYKLNADGEIYYIDTTNKGSNEGLDTIKQINSVDDGALYYRKTGRWFGKKVVYNANTLFISVPSDESDYDGYQLASPSNLTEGKSYSLDAYAEYSNLMKPTVIMISDAYVTNFELAYIYVYTGHAMELVDEEIYHKLELFGGQEGAEVIIHAPTDTKRINFVDFEGIDDLNKGDVIVFSKDGKGFVSGIRKVFDHKTMKQIYEIKDISYTRRVITAKVFEQNEGYVALSLDDITSDTTIADCEIIEAERFKIYVYNEDTEIARVGTVADLLDYQMYGEDCSTVVVSEQDGVPRNIIVFEK